MNLRIKYFKELKDNVSNLLFCTTFNFFYSLFLTCACVFAFVKFFPFLFKSSPSLHQPDVVVDEDDDDGWEVSEE